jgi:uncharacterized protein (DUF934 family)
MITRRDSLTDALDDIEAGRLTDASTIVINLNWWQELSVAEQERFRHRAERAAVDLRADEALSSHFVEVRGGDEGPPLSSERPM